MKASEVYLRAAELMDSPNFPCGCCKAICTFDGGLAYSDSPVAAKFHALFRQFNGARMSDFGPYGEPYRGHRVLALCLMSAIARDSERGK